MKLCSAQLSLSFCLALFSFALLPFALLTFALPLVQTRLWPQAGSTQLSSMPGQPSLVTNAMTAHLLRHWARTLPGQAIQKIGHYKENIMWAFWIMKKTLCGHGPGASKRTASIGCGRLAHALINGVDPLASSHARFTSTPLANSARRIFQGHALRWPYPHPCTCISNALPTLAMH